MLVNIHTKKLNLNKCSINDHISDWIEQDIIVPDSKPDAVKIVNLTVTPYVNDFEIMDGKIKVIGKINYFIIYMVDDEKFNTRGLFVSHPYSEILNVDGITSSMNANIDCRCKNVIYSLPNERKIAVKSEIVFDVCVKDCVEVNLIQNFDEESNIECKMCNKNFSNIIQSKSNIIASKEDVMLPKEAEDFFEILDLETNIVNTEFKESYNKIMVKGDIDIKIIYLADNQNESIKTVKLIIPFSAMIELENINDRSKFDIKYKMRDFSIKLNEDITSTKTMTANYQIDVDVVMYEDEELEYVEDFYSQTKELDYNSESVEAVSKNFIHTKNIDIKETLSNILPQNTTILNYTIDTNNINSSLKNGVVELDGNAKISLLLQDLSNMELENKVVDILINEKFDLENVPENMNGYVDIIGKNVSITQSGLDLEVRLSIDIRVNIENITVLNIIEKIEDRILNLLDMDSINIYIVKPEDSLWKIAKKYKTSIEKIVKTNDISNPDEIDIGQKLLIIR